MREVELTDLEREKYKRQMMIFGEEGQRRLKGAGALVTRVGGLGGPTAHLLGRRRDREVSNSPYGQGDPLQLKPADTHDARLGGEGEIVKAVESVRGLNPDVEIIPMGARRKGILPPKEHPSVRERAITGENIDELVGMVDVICDCAPTFEERFLLNEAAVRHRKPMVEAAMYGMEEYLTVIIPGETPCLRCLYPEDPEWEVPFPVLGAVSGSLGCLAVIEAINQDFRKFKVRRAPNCPVCGGVGA